MRTEVAGLLLAISALVPAGASGQAGRMLEGAPRAPADPFAVCATDPFLPAGGTETGCDVVEAIDLGLPVEAWLLRYRRTAEVPEGGVVAVVEIEEYALIEAAGSGYRVIWRHPVDRRFRRLGGVTVSAAGGATLLSYPVCAAACAPEFLVRDGGGWGAVDKAYLGELGGLAPEGWSLQEGGQVDGRSLSGSRPLLGPDDQPCCPSGLVRFTLALRGRALVVQDATVEIPEPEPADSAGGPEPPGR